MAYHVPGAMKQPAFVLSGIFFAGMALAQDLPPGVLLLSRVKNHMREELQRLTTISCLETVAREYQPAKGKMRPLDTVRLEVLTNGDREFFASPGGRKFSADHPFSYVGSGMLGNGLFGPYLKDILVREVVASEYRGEEQVGGRRLARFDFRIPVLFSDQSIETPEGSGKVGLHGSFWADPQNYDVTRLELDADDFPPTLPVTELTTRIDYARTRLSSDLALLLPEAADVRLVKESGVVEQNRVEFTHCRVFGAESNINFDAPDSPQPAPRFAAAAVDDTLRPLPGGLPVTVMLRSRITGDTAVGTLVEGVVANNVTLKRAVVIPAGSTVRGRIRRLERYTDPFPYFVVGLEFTEVEVEGIRRLFYADLVGIDPVAGVERFLATKDTTTATGPADLSGSTSFEQVKERLTLYSIPGVASFFVKGAKLELPPNFRTEWKTRALKP